MGIHDDAGNETPLLPVGGCTFDLRSENLEKLIYAQKKQVDIQQDQIEILKDQLGVQRGQLEAYERLTEKQKEVDKKEEEIRALTATLNKRDGTIKDLKMTVESLRSDKAVLDKHNKELTSEVEDLTDRNEVLTTKLDRAIAQWNAVFKVDVAPPPCEGTLEFSLGGVAQPVVCGGEMKLEDIQVTHDEWRVLVLTLYLQGTWPVSVKLTSRLHVW
eukprot:Platyproteum_vivax@DN1970_c0_g1_i1.p1